MTKRIALLSNGACEVKKILDIFSKRSKLSEGEYTPTAAMRARRRARKSQCSPIPLPNPYLSLSAAVVSIFIILVGFFVVQMLCEEELIVKRRCLSFETIVFFAPATNAKNRSLPIKDERKFRS